MEDINIISPKVWCCWSDWSVAGCL